MEKLLHWSIVNAQGDKEEIAKAGAPDPRLLEQLFGKGNQVDDPTLMKEALLVAKNKVATAENRIIALENFEMLIENLDNANNIENMKMWEPLINLLVEENLEIVALVCSIIGTAVQNNVDSQTNFTKYENGMKTLIELANTTSNIDVKIKALYALSNTIRNNEKASAKFKELNGLDVISPILKDKTVKPKIKLRTINLLSAYMSTININEEFVTALRKDNIISTIIERLQEDTDLNLIDRILNFLSQLYASKIKLTDAEKATLEKGFNSIQHLQDSLNEEDFASTKSFL
ncbi:hypothetical protein TBLA_0B02500 [Henningerozyma blattae CBS 6284]|uniref:Hsp70 nucleotide exchange factor FES1 n=1 Tax=Henningerozyma blattae (strain ATCC 34711 / CBS 6284 / DSM 70876 / NBRC 10599 / NRRL Y-10934 / UCD 77-7) TaxID=1071380 RepID=I2GY90_HENB6|nr:hypothetical protein TBLA_0B02500 [Tetrapisispora blattae CBS 6284]CCH59092.1 hypothetical protein TBLA_0B02500 [Tetrapisispora blattae CBS 6284]